MKYPDSDPNTTLFVDQCAKKWAPLTDGMSKAKKARCAYVLEQEARFLNSILDEKRDEIGAHLKFVFPVLRAIHERLGVNETGHRQVWKAADAAFDQVCPPPRYGNGMWDCVIRDYPEKHPFIKPLVERTHASLIAYKKILRSRPRPPVMG
jgi:hypothetical protein